MDSPYCEYSQAEKYRGLGWNSCQDHRARQGPQRYGFGSTLWRYIANMQYTKVTLLATSKELRDDGSIVEVVIWELPEPLPPREHRYKYRLFLGWPGREVVRYDNERGKGDHRHIDGEELPYVFTTLFITPFASAITLFSDGVEAEPVVPAAAQLEANKALIRRVFKAFNDGDLATLNEISDSRRTIHTATGSTTRDGAPRKTLAEACSMCAALKSRSITVDVIMAEGDLVTVRSTWRGKYSGTVRDMPIAGKGVTVYYTNTYRIKDGKLGGLRQVASFGATGIQRGAPALSQNLKRGCPHAGLGRLGPLISKPVGRSDRGL